MFACMRIACGGEDIEKNIDERTRDGVLLPFEAIYSLVSKSVCVSLLWSCHTTCLSKIVL
jgi:hypothetical protein